MSFEDVCARMSCADDRLCPMHLSCRAAPDASEMQSNCDENLCALQSRHAGSRLLCLLACL